ncbi:MAG TPA: DoxX family membrane protein [Gaiellales bacterium]|jgi:uncharacterized membrane protein YphA (DoxX/SURF4 family)|nr:DoxX family membrane protein [Gaiellales bacterium]
MSARSPFEDRPAIGIALVRFGLALLVIVTGVFQVQRHHAAVADARVWGLPSPSFSGVAIPFLAIFLGVILLLGIAPRLAAWLILAEAIIVMIAGGRTDGGFYLTLPPVFMVLALIVIGGGGGRWALVDRLDPPRQRRLDRSR